MNHRWMKASLMTVVFVACTKTSPMAALPGETPLLVGADAGLISSAAVTARGGVTASSPGAANDDASAALPPTPEARGTIEQTLRGIATGGVALEPLVVEYTDLHGLHGGLRLTIDGRGHVVQEAVRVKAGVLVAQVAEEQLRQLVQLLLQRSAWRQLVPERSPVPDESRATLTISYGGKTSAIWEWYNDLDSGKRIVVIRELMKKLAWR